MDNSAGAERGLGLGLSIVERISRVLDHEVQVTSMPGRGSHFSMRLPLADAASSVLRPVDAPLPATGVGGAVVLCLDNEPQVLDGLSTLLTGWGCGVLTARSSREAEAVVAAAPRIPDICIIDYHLDESDGVAAAEALRTRFDSLLPAILITADRSPEAKAAAQRAGMPILHKPIRPAALRAAIAQSMVSRRAAAE